MVTHSLLKIKQPSKCLRCGGQIINSTCNDEVNCLQCGALYTKGGKLAAYFVQESRLHLPEWLRI